MRKFYLILLSLCSVYLSAQNNMAGYTYWFNNDFAGRIVQNTASVNTLDLQVDIPAESLPDGLHIFHMMLFDDSARYSSPVSRTFFKAGIAATSGNKNTAYRYWFNYDMAQADTVLITPESTSTIIAELDASMLNHGLNIL